MVEEEGERKFRLHVEQLLGNFIRMLQAVTNTEVLKTPLSPIGMAFIFYYLNIPEVIFNLLRYR